jgi:hypothetical protein
MTDKQDMGRRRKTGYQDDYLFSVIRNKSLDKLTTLMSSVAYNWNFPPHETELFKRTIYKT